MRKTAITACTALALVLPLAAGCDNLAAQAGGGPTPELESIEAVEGITVADLAGRWAGVLDVGAAELNLVLLLREGEGALAGELISVDQSNTAIPLSSVTLEGSMLEFTDTPRGASFSGVVANDGRIIGTFTQRGVSFPLNLERAESPSGVDAAASEDTVVTVTDPETGASHQLAGTLQSPEGVLRAGVVILSGSGSQDRDGMTAGQALYAAWADILADAGIASLRLDDRGVGGSDPVVPESPIDLAKDGAAALETLGAGTGAQCIGFVGHSEGGWTGLIAAHMADADFVVSMAGMHEPMATTLARQSEAIIRAAGGGDAAVEANGELQNIMFEILLAAELGVDNSAPIEAALLEAGAPSAVAQQQAAIWGQPYAAASFQMDPRDAAAAYQGAVLGLFAGNDLQVLAEPNAAALEAARADVFTRTVTVPGVDHLFQVNETGSLSSYGSVGHAIAPQAAAALREELDALLGAACT